MGGGGEGGGGKFANPHRDWWIADLGGHNFRCEPAWLPGEALRDPHLREVGLSVNRESGEDGPMTVLGPVVTVTPLAPGGGAGRSPHPAGPARERGPLSHARVLDPSACLAGPGGPVIPAPP